MPHPTLTEYKRTAGFLAALYTRESGREGQARRAAQQAIEAVVGRALTNDEYYAAMASATRTFQRSFGVGFCNRSARKADIRRSMAPFVNEYAVRMEARHA